MNTRLNLWSAVVLFLSVSVVALQAENKPLYENNFEKAEVGKVPDDFLVIDGAFAVAETNGNKFLELPGAPLDTFRVLFGPTTNANIAVTAKIFGTAKGRRGPTFAVGLNGIGGYRLQVSPQKKMLEFYKGDDLIKGVPFGWKSGEWTNLRIELKKAGDNKLVLSGKAWAKSDSEPKDPQLTFDVEGTPAAGRPSVLASPYSGTPVWFDDLQVTAVQ